MTERERQLSPGFAPSGDVAIVGMACLFPGAPDLDTYWHNILTKVDAVGDPPAGEWDPDIFYDPSSKSNDRVYCKRGGYIGDLADFRPLDFGVMPVTVDGGEPDQWLALRIASEALADAGHTEPPNERMRTEVILGKGTYVNRGNLTVGYHALVVEHVLRAIRNLHPEYTDDEIAEIKQEIKAGLPPFSADTAPALIGNIIAGRVANRFDLMGPSYTVDAACASALAAIDIGVQNLLSNKCDLVLAGGANVNAPLPTLSLFCQLGALSRSEQIRPFDAKADGTILGEGIGMIVLKRKEDALRDGDRIYAFIKGVGMASDGRAQHVLAPRVEGEELALRRAYERAGVSPRTVGLVEAHGTATPVGDVVEVQALSRVFGEREGTLPSCALGSVKSMIGHTMPAAGIAGLIKAALSLYHRVLPPSINCDVPNPVLQLEKTPFYINTETRPWIHGGEEPRRAGVNSFGFGGINGHVVLEEAPEPATPQPSHLLRWDSEVFILEADTREELVHRAIRLREYLGRADDAIDLKDLSYTINTRLQNKPARISVVATSVADLAQKLDRALDRLAIPKTRQIKDNAGIFYFEEPLGGKLAFLFPGEGSQYPNMLLDLCLHFPEVRQCFDIGDRTQRSSGRAMPPSDVIYPRSILSPEEQAIVDKALWEIDGAVECVLIGNWAMSVMLDLLAIRPDMIVGHSSGDYSAMLASRIVDMSHDRYVEAVQQWNASHGRLADRGPVPAAILVAVASDAATVQSIAASIGGDLFLAMDNCPHQTVVAGEGAAIDRLLEELRSRAIIYEVLPFDRPYHTPLFLPYSSGLESQFFAQLPVASAKIATYSCTSAARYPDDSEGIRKLYTEHWISPVRFRETIEQMHEDGARIFVEAGPRGNLTAFVSDTLRGKPHLAMPANVPRRSGISQIQHLVAALAAQGVPLSLEAFYARRRPKAVEWESASAQPAASGRPAPMKLKLGLPPLTVLPRERRPETGPTPKIAPTPAWEPSVPLERTQQPSVPAAVSVAAPVAVGRRPDRFVAPRASALVMQEYLSGMESFLDVERQVVEAYLNRHGAPAAGSPVARHSNRFALLGEVAEHIPGERLRAIRELRLDEDVFLLDHALGGRISVTDPSLRPLVVLPLTMSLEMLAEAASALRSGKTLVEVRQLRATRWISVGDTPVRLEVSAAGASDEVAVQIRDLGAGPTSPPVVTATAIFAGSYPPPPAPMQRDVLKEGVSRLTDKNLYDGRLMFHGPCFQGVSKMLRSGPDSATAELQVLPANTLFRSNPSPRFVTDPVVLDAAGQLVGFWAAERLEKGFVVFPYQLDSLRIYGPNRPAAERLGCSLRIELRGSDTTRSDIEVTDAAGKVWLRLEGWADRRFDPPPRFHEGWTRPHEATLSEPWPAAIRALSSPERIECQRMGALDRSGFWGDLAASLVLTRRERKVFQTLRGPDRRKQEWLASRIAAKDAVRLLLRKHHGIELLPADIDIAEDENGRPLVRGSWTSAAPCQPEVSITHSEGMAVALAGYGCRGRRYGVDIQFLREPGPGFESLALNAEEQRLLAPMSTESRQEWLFRLWAAKEAISKALGYGLIEGPASVRVSWLNPDTGEVRARPRGKLSAAAGGTGEEEMVAFTLREAAVVAASVVYDKGTS